MNASPTERPVYLDNQATTRCDPRVLETMLPWFSEEYGNPHSLDHAMGLRAEAAIEKARGQVAAMIGAEPREIVFTSGATESSNIAIKGVARFARRMNTPRRRIISSAIEHKCVLQCVADAAEFGLEPVILPVGRDGLVQPNELAEALREPTLLVSIMAVNNEIGVIQDVRRLAALSRAAGALFHTDAPQAIGKIGLDAEAAGIDLLSLSGHKIYGPKGVGALYVRRRPRVRLDPIFSGGGQERGLRPGTLPTPLAVGLGEAARIAAAEMQTEATRIGGLAARLLEKLRREIPGVRLNGSAEARIPGNLSVTFPEASAASLMARAPGLCVSVGSACTSAEVEPSHVLTAIGLTREEAARTLRVGIGRFNSAADIDYAAACLGAAHAASLPAQV
ncbi:MAG: cysteine desulfurase [Acetobacteraceae bacterium]|nr:cysteine desulfurase [Acetobacteraceae bacterium]